VDPERVKTFLFFVLVFVSGGVFVYLISPFFRPIFWAAVLAALFFPVYEGILLRLHSKNLSSFLTLILITAVIIVPFFIVGGLILMESVDLFESLNPEASQAVDKAKIFLQHLARYPILKNFSIDAASITRMMAEGTQKLMSFLLDNLRHLTQNTVVFVAKFFVMLYVLFFFLRDGERLGEEIKSFLPFEEKKKEALFDSFARTAKATLKVTVIIGGVQGAIGAVLFLLLGVKGALTWGVIMAVSSIIPGVGCAIIWAPAGIIMILMGEVVKGIVIILVGALFISTVDSVLRPLLLGQDMEMHPLMIFLTSLGGIVAFGMTGFVLGPIIGALFLAFLEMYREYHTKGELTDVE